MRRILVSIATVLMTVLSVSAQKPAIPRDEAIEAKIQQRMAKMTLEEKVGQMLQFSVDQITYTDPRLETMTLLRTPKADMKKLIASFNLQNKYNVDELYNDQGKLRMPDAAYTLYIFLQDVNKREGFRLDEQKMALLFGKYHIGSILNMLGGEATPPEVWQKAMSELHRANSKFTDIPILYGLDQVHGSTYSAGGTLFPQHIGMAATFNPLLAQQMGQVAAYESRACGVGWIFCPDLDLGRKPSWSRCYEGMGEDPLLASVMGEAYLDGIQGPDPNHIGKYHTGTTLKHYMGYGIPDNGIDRTPATVTLQDLREKYFEPFRRVIQHGALGVMTNSAILNGMKGCANYDLITNWLKRDLNWDGMVITDWGDTDGLWNTDHITANKKEAIAKVINAGTDMLMVTADTTYFTLLKELVQEKQIPMSRINDAVARVLRLKYRIGLFDKPFDKLKDYPLFGSQQHADMARQTALESMVLLKNDSLSGRALLPLRKGQKLLVCGPNANTMRGLNGGWSYTWQGSNTEKFTTLYKTIYKALAEKFGSENVRLSEGVSYNNKANWQEEFAEGIDSTVAAARNCDVIVACIGENSYAETTGSILDDNLSPNQQRLVEALAKTGKPIVLILNEGRARLIHGLVPKAKAIVDIMLPGNYGGEALAQLLAGEENFSGRLPFTYPSFANAFTTYDYKMCEKREVVPGIYNYSADTNAEWWFGTGLSYTHFSYANLRVDKTTFGKDDVLKVSVDVTNTGAREGKEVVMLYSTDMAADDVTPDNCRLRCFEKINLKPGDTKTVSFSLPAKDLSYVNRSGEWTLEPGDFKLAVANQKLIVTCTE